MSYVRLYSHGHTLGLILLLIAISSALPLQAQSISAPAGKAFTMPAQAPESAAEAQNKEIALAWFKLTFIEGKAAAAFEKYVSHDFVEHSRRLRGGYESTLKVLSMMKPRMLKPIAVVNDDIVLLQSEIGNEVFRIQNGKISDHWDLNP